MTFGKLVSSWCEFVCEYDGDLIESETFVIVTMDSSCVPNGDVSGFKDKESMVDPFLVEALENPRHRVTS